MKQIYLTIIIAIGLLAGCKDAEIAEKDYPFLETFEVENNDSLGVTLKAELLREGKYPITDYGFIWSDGTNNHMKSLFNEVSLKEFSYRISVGINKNSIYTCKAYIKTSKHLVYGNEVRFIGQLGRKWQIIDFSPKEGFDSTLVTLTGKHFNWSSTDKLYFNKIQVEVISTSDSSIVFRTPNQSFVGDAEIEIEINSLKITLPSKFKIFGPVINFVAPLSGTSGKIVTIYGDNLTENGKKLEVYFDGYKAEIKQILEFKMNVIIPTPTNSLLSPVSTTVKLINGSKSTECKDKFVIKNSWTQKKEAPFSWTYDYQSFTYNGRGYIYEYNYGDIFEYNPIDNSWSKFSDSKFPGQIYNSIFVNSNDKLYRIGGNLDYQGTFNQELWEYDLSKKTWTKKTDIPFKYKYASHFEFNNVHYVVTNYAEVWKCNFAEGVYTKLNNLPSGFSGFSFAFVANGSPYFVVYGHTWMYDVQNDQWIVRNSNPFFRDSYCFDADGFSLNNTGYVLNNGRELYKYDAFINKWIIVSKYPKYYHDAEKTVFVIGNTAYVAAIYSHSTSGGPFMFAYQE